MTIEHYPTNKSYEDLPQLNKGMDDQPGVDIPDEPTSVHEEVAGYTSGDLAEFPADIYGAD